MSAHKKIMFDGVADTLQYIKEKCNENAIPLGRNKKPQLYDVLFRDKSLGLLEVINDSFLKKKLSKKLNEITIMTYAIKTNFSSDVLSMIRMANDNALITIAFKYEKEEIENNKGGNNIEKAFEDIFSINENISINVIANPNTHIKLLQLDDVLYTGSMNFSSTADSVNKSTWGDLKDSYYNHEVIFHFNEGGRDISRGVIKKLKHTDDSVCFTISIKNFKKELGKHLNDARFIKGNTKIKDDKIRRNELISKQKNHEMELFIKDLIEEIVRNELIDKFGLEIQITLNEYSLEYDDAKKIVTYFTDLSNREEFIESLIESGFKNAIEGNEDEDEIKEYVRVGLANILNSSSEYLCELMMDEASLREDILSERLDYDTGECVEDLFGEKSEYRLEKQIENNKKAVFEFIVDLIQELSEEIYNEKFYSLPFFTKKISS